MFNDPIAVAEFRRLAERFQVQLLVETGTQLGIGSLAAAQVCPVLTVEINPDYRRQALERFAAHPHPHPIISLPGSSPEVLRMLRLSGRCCFYLDAHWQEYWPLRDELDAIAAMGKPDSLLIIHDCKVPGQPWGFDSYHGQDLDLEYVSDGLRRINPLYEIAYNERAAGNCRGILYATPPLHTLANGNSVTP